jgi:Family of unknown function (DUF6011)
MDHTPLLNAENFDLAVHNGMVTMRNPATGDHRTFRIATQADDAAFAHGKRIVSLLSGPDRDDPADWRAFGFAEDGRVKVWSRFRGTDGSRSVWDVYGRLLTWPSHFSEKKGLVYLIEAKCRRCNRPLTVPASIALGYGPECSERALGSDPFALTVEARR